MCGMWRRHKVVASAGMAACLTMVVTSASSGPILSTAAAIGAMSMWPMRRRMQLVRWAAVVGGYVALDFVMQAPAYYLIGRIDLTGSSTGWHRARLIESAFRHLNEWWLGGTDHTRHWMATGVVWSADHTDITNHYLHMGVIGGLPLMILFILVIAQAFRLIGKELRADSAAAGSAQFFLWTVGRDTIYACCHLHISVVF